ncbi:hypothetical protein X742_35090 [Mesorhizobium sp. LNHC232B00]|nr:hypothetical protein X742_35090 [Mesorhizobium sp. LNHC232B00]
MAGGDRHDDGVLIENVELVKTPEGFCPSLIWLKALDDPLGQRGRATQAFVEALLKQRFGGTYWELGVFNDVSTGSAIGDNKRGGEVVERGAEIVNHVANDAAPLSGDGLIDLEPMEIAAGLRIYLDGDGVWLTFLECFDQPVKITKVMFGPIDLQPGAEQKVTFHG